MIKNGQGRVLAARVERNKAIKSPEIVEALTCRMGIKLAISLNIPTAAMESDCLTLIQKLRAKIEETTEIGEIIADIKFLCNSFTLVSFFYVPRANNVIAHNLAQLSFTFNESGHSWLNSLPRQLPEAVSVI